MIYIKLIWLKVIGMMVFMKEAVFDLYFRSMPFNGGYAVFNGLKRVIDFMDNFGFSETDIEYLRSIGYQDDF